MATAEDYCGTWTFFGCDSPEAERAYPVGRTVAIGKQHDEGKLMLAWTDADRTLHVLTGLVLDESGHLTARGVQDLATPYLWDITIKPSSTQTKRIIQASVKSIRQPGDGLGEGNLTGNWGADAPPNPGDGQPS